MLSASRDSNLHRPDGRVAFDMFVDDMALLLEAGHGSAHRVWLPAGEVRHVFEACTGAGLKEGEQLRCFGYAGCSSFCILGHIDFLGFKGRQYAALLTKA